MQFGTQQPVIHYAGPTMDVRGAFIKAAGLAKYSPTEPPQLIVTFVSVGLLIRATSDRTAHDRMLK